MKLNSSCFLAYINKNDTRISSACRDHELFIRTKWGIEIDELINSTTH